MRSSVKWRAELLANEAATGLVIRSEHVSKQVGPYFLQVKSVSVSQLNLK